VCRLGTHGGAAELKAHPFFARVKWDELRHMPAPNIPMLEHELDTQNFEKFDEAGDAPLATSGKRYNRRADTEFMGFTYKNISVRPSTFRLPIFALPAQCILALHQHICNQTLFLQAVSRDGSSPGDGAALNVTSVGDKRALLRDLHLPFESCLYGADEYLFACRKACSEKSHELLCTAELVC
jgi:Protein kinase C terminal domain